MKCRYFCRLPLDISPVYLTRGISVTSTHRSLDSVPKPVLLLPEKPDFSESVRLHLKKNRTTHFCDKDEVLFQSFQAFLHKKDP